MSIDRKAPTPIHGAALEPEFQQSTLAVRAGLECDDHTGCVVPPIHLTSTFAFRGFGEKRAYDYTRSGNPTRDLLANALTELEEGAGGVVTSTGMSAITLVGYLIPAGARIVAPHDCYGGTYRLFNAWHQRGERKVAAEEHPAPADAVAEGAAGQRQRGVGDRVDGGGPLQPREADAEVALDRRQRHRHEPEVDGGEHPSHAEAPEAGALARPAGVAHGSIASSLAAPHASVATSAASTRRPRRRAVSARTGSGSSRSPDSALGKASAIPASKSRQASAPE